MEQQQFLIKDFEIFNTKNAGGLFYTPSLSAHVTHSKILALLVELKQRQKQGIEESTLDKLIIDLTLEVPIVKKYLIRSLKVLIPQDDMAFKKLFLCVEDAFIQGLLETYFTEGQGVQLYVGDDFSALDSDSLVIFFQNHYLPQAFEKVQQLIVERDAWILSAYMANEYLVINNIYQARKGMPCHFCNFYRHQNIVMSTNSVKKTSWINFCRKVITEDIHFFPAISLTDIEKSGIVYWLAKAMQNFIGNSQARLFMNETTEYSWINLHSGEKTQEQSVHWAFCECLQQGAA